MTVPAEAFPRYQSRSRRGLLPGYQSRRRRGLLPGYQNPDRSGRRSLLLLLLATDPAFRRSPTPAHPPRDSAKLPTPTHACERTRTHANTRTRTSHAGTPLWAHSPARHLGPTAARPAMKIGVLSRPPAGRKRLSFRCIEKAAKAAAGPACCSYGELESGGDVSALPLNPKHVQALSWFKRV